MITSLTDFYRTFFHMYINLTVTTDKLLLNIVET